MVSSSARNAKDHRQSLSPVLGNPKSQTQQVESCCRFQGVKVEALGQKLGGTVIGQTARARNGASKGN